MIEPSIRVLAPGPSLSLQDGGRSGWRRFGVPPAGPLDRYSADQANLLLGNRLDATVLEVILLGCQLEILRDTWIALAGASLCSQLPSGTGALFRAGERLRFDRSGPGMCCYLAVPGGIVSDLYFRSASTDTRNGIGQPLVKGSELSSHLEVPGFAGDPISRRLISPEAVRDFSGSRTFELLRGPQWELFSEETRELLARAEWSISSRSDRTGFRLKGPALTAPSTIPSEPVLMGSIQVPGDGVPIITLHDGPTVGGYPKVAVMRESDLNWLAQCSPSVKINFRWNESC